MPGLLVIEAPDLLLSGDVIWPVRSAFTWHVGVPNMLFMVPLKISDILRREGVGFTGGSFDRRRQGQPGGTYKDLIVSCFIFRVVFVSCGM